MVRIFILVIGFLCLEVSPHSLPALLFHDVLGQLEEPLAAGARGEEAAHEVVVGPGVDPVAGLDPALGGDGQDARGGQGQDSQ